MGNRKLGQGKIGGLGLGLMLLCACQTEVPPGVEQPQPLPQDPIVEVYFNHNSTAKYTEPYRHRTRQGDDLEAKIVAAIQSAHSSVDVAVQEFRLPRVAQALADRHRAGVRVRVILENTYSRPWSSLSNQEIARLDPRDRGRYQEFRRLVDRNGDHQVSQAEINQGDALVILQKAGIPRIDDTANGSAGSGLMHHKFVVVDQQLVIATSANFTPSDAHGDFAHPASTGNANNLLRIESRELAVAFTEEFNLMWGDGPGGKPDSKFGPQKPWRSPRQFTFGKTTLTVQFSPTSPTLPWERSTNGLIGKTLSTATQSIDLALFVFSEQHLVNLLETRQQEGVKIKTLIDPGFAYRPYSEALDMLGISLLNPSQRRDNCTPKANNRPWKNPITTVGVPRLARGDLLHHKFGLIDDTTIVTGSHNWTESANQNNDETLLVIHSPWAAAHFRREFDRLYGTAVTGLPPTIRRKAAAQKKKCHLNL
ncbi:competence protein ComE [Leptolyngbya sp. 'hensonii']|nr:competence protein ComE [Leptolyngbya sp. 'hensonii']